MVSGGWREIRGTLVVQSAFEGAKYFLADVNNSIASIFNPNFVVDLDAALDTRSLRIVAVPESACRVVTQVGVELDASGVGQFRTFLNLPPSPNNESPVPVVESAQLGFEEVDDSIVPVVTLDRSQLGRIRRS